MTSAYLGETRLTLLTSTPYDGFTQSMWALEFIARYGQIDGDHHAKWVLDQIARVLHGTPVIVSVAQWEGGKVEYRIETETPPSSQYLKWVERLKVFDTETGEFEYDYDEGRAP